MGFRGEGKAHGVRGAGKSSWGSGVRVKAHGVQGCGKAHGVRVQVKAGGVSGMGKGSWGQGCGKAHGVRGAWKRMLPPCGCSPCRVGTQILTCPFLSLIFHLIPALRLWSAASRHPGVPPRHAHLCAATPTLSDGLRDARTPCRLEPRPHTRHRSPSVPALEEAPAMS